MAVERGGNCLAVTNHGRASGWARQWFACKKAGIKPIFGLEAYVNEHRFSGVREDLTQARLDAKAKKPGAAERVEALATLVKEKFRPSRHCVLLAKTRQGFRNLTHLTTDAWRRGFYYVPRMDSREILGHAEGLIYSTACIGGYLPSMARHDYAAAVAEARRFMGVFGPENFVVEIMVTPYAKQRETNEIMLRLAHEIGAKTIVTCDVHYAEARHAKAQSALLLMRDKATFADVEQKGAGEGPWQFEAKDLFFRGMRDVVACYRQHHAAYFPREDFLRAVRNTFALVDSIEPIDFDTAPKLPFVCDNPEQVLAGLVAKATQEAVAARRIPAPGFKVRDYVDRVRRELGVIQGKSFGAYFLILEDLVRFVRREGVLLGPGRGSAAGSLVAFLLGITEVDPLKYGLLFERFLDPGRADLPDVDLDFAPADRERVKAYLAKRYPGQTASIRTFSTFGVRATMRDVGRVFGIDDKETLAVTKGLGTEADETPWDQVRADHPTVDAWADAHPDAWEVCATLRNLVSHTGKHAAGLLIAPLDALAELPMEWDSETNEAMTAYGDTQGDGSTEDRELSRLGYLKLDILGVDGLEVVPRALRFVRERGGPEIRAQDLDLEHPEALRIAATGNVPGIFQFDTPVSRPLLRQIPPRHFFDLAIITALARPGPRDNGLHDEFARLRAMGENWRREVPEAVQGRLERTMGLMVFQEDIMWTLQILGGFSMVEANKVRKIISKKLSPELLLPHLQKFVDGGVAQGYDAEMLARVFSTLQKYANYAFVAAHATSYAMTAMRQLAVLADYPLEYFASLLATTPRNRKGFGDEDRMVGYMRAATRRGIPVLPPDVLADALDFQPEGQAIRYGISKIKGIANGAEAIREAVRQMPEASLGAMIEKVDRRRCTARGFEILAYAGALDRLALDESAEPVRAAMARVTEPIERRNVIRAAHLHAVTPIPKRPSSKPRPEAPWLTAAELRDKERDLLGMVLSWWASPEPARLREELDLDTVAEVLAAPQDRRFFRVLAEITKARAHKTARGEMGFLALADESGELGNVVAWKETWSASRELLVVGQVCVVRLERRHSQRPEYGMWSYFPAGTDRVPAIMSLAEAEMVAS